MEIITRDTARVEGVKFYFTGLACIAGHIDVRYVSVGRCKSCCKAGDQKEKARRRSSPDLVAAAIAKRKRLYAADPTKHRQASRRYRTNHPPSDEARAIDNARRCRQYAENSDREKVRQSRWRSENAALKKELDAKWQKDNPERVKQRNVRWKTKNRDAVRSHTRNYRAKKRAADGYHAADDIKAMFDIQGGVCACGCGASLAAAFQVDHKIPISRGGSNWPDNLQLLMPICNQRKNDRTMEEWIAIRANSNSSDGLTGDNRK